jgi:hypothetical protein
MRTTAPTARLLLVLLLLGSFLVFASRARAASASLIPASDLREDAAVLRRAYEALHPGLYRYNTKAQMDAHFAELEAALGRDQTLGEAYLAVSLFLAKVRCGHTYANFFNQQKAVADALFKGADRVPFYFRWIDGRMIVTRSFAPEPRVRPGTEVLAIDGVPAREILARLLAVARADGSNDAKRVSYLEVAGESEYEAFDVFYPMLFPQRGDSREYALRGPATRRAARVRLASLTFDERVAPIRAELEARRGDGGPLWRLEYLGADVAYLRMRSWAVYDTKWDWKGFLDGALDEVARRGTPNLVVDLRGNEGGLDVGDLVLARLVDRDLALGGYRRLVRYRTVPTDLAPYLDTWDPSFKEWGAAAVGPEDGFYRLTRYDDDERGRVIAPKLPRYRGRVFVLVDAANSSATFEFAAAVKRNGLGTLVGQPTGGNQRGINGGAFFFLRLPRSKIEVDLPLIGTFPAAPAPDAGIAPDVFVRPRASDVAAGVDAELAAVRSLIQRRGRR